jgi:DNA-binding transcriptional LysR family regulator
MRRNIERRIWTKEIHVSRVLEMDSVHGMIDFVANSKWATILPLMSVAHDIKSDGLCINPIVEPYLEADVYLINLMQRPLRATAQVFVQAIQRELESISKVDMQ